MVCLKCYNGNSEHRNNLPDNLLIRTVKVEKGAGLLHYSKYSNGYKTKLNDLFVQWI